VQCGNDPPRARLEVLGKAELYAALLGPGAQRRPERSCTSSGEIEALQ